MTFEGEMKKMWDGGYSKLAEFHLRKPIYFVASQEEIDEFHRWCEENTKEIAGRGGK